jgi:hypothetical protein
MSRNAPRMNSRSRLVALLVGAGLAAPLALVSAPAMAQNERAPAAARGAEKAAASDQDLPIRKITLYRSGVGYFERAGSVRGDAEIQLRFSTEQINDILKSMVVVLDPKSGRLEAVSYGSKEPLARRLASFGVDISKNPTVPELLNQLRGAPIKVVAAGDQITGTILGVEQRKVPPVKDQAAYDAPHLNLVTQTGMRSIAVSDISSFELLDKDLATELNKALSALAEYRADRSKTVNLRFSGASGNALPVTVAYIHEMPVWKTSYRLILPDESAKKESGKPSTLNIRGWAIVENNTDHDWNDVKLSLVSGRPVSFQMDLYEPLYVFRPMIPVPTVPGVAPRAYAGGVDAELGKALVSAGEEARASRRDAGRSRGGMAPGSPPAPAAAAESLAFKTAGDKAGYAGLSAGDMADYAAAAQAQAGEVGEVFQYELEAPVTIERQRSAMIPILSAAVSGRRVSIFSLADRSEYPMRGVELKNDSSLQLLPGPIAVFDGNENTTAYAGDAQIGHIGQGDKRLLAYAVDLDVKVLTSAENNVTVTHLKIVDGLFEQTIKTQSTTSYAMQNNDQKRARTVVIEQAKNQGWSLVKPEKPSEETQALYRFELPLASGKAGTLAVLQERTDAQRIGITDIDLPTILAYQKSGKVSDKVVEAVREIGKRQGVINQAERDIQELDRQIGEINKDQARIRGNMAGIAQSSQLYTRYMTKLTEQETQLDTLGERRIKGQESLDKLKNELVAYIRALNVE